MQIHSSPNICSLPPFTFRPNLAGRGESERSKPKPAIYDSRQKRIFKFTVCFIIFSWWLERFCTKFFIICEITLVSRVNVCFTCQSGLTMKRRLHVGNWILFALFCVSFTNRNCANCPLFSQLSRISLVLKIYIDTKGISHKVKLIHNKRKQLTTTINLECSLRSSYTTASASLQSAFVLCPLGKWKVPFFVRFAVFINYKAISVSRRRHCCGCID